MHFVILPVQSGYFDNEKYFRSEYPVIGNALARRVTSPLLLQHTRTSSDGSGRTLLLGTGRHILEVLLIAFLEETNTDQMPEHLVADEAGYTWHS